MLEIIIPKDIILLIIYKAKINLPLEIWYKINDHYYFNFRRDYFKNFKNNYSIYNGRSTKDNDYKYQIIVDLLKRETYILHFRDDKIIYEQWSIIFIEHINESMSFEKDKIYIRRKYEIKKFIYDEIFEVHNKIEDRKNRKLICLYMTFILLLIEIFRYYTSNSFNPLFLILYTIYAYNYNLKL